jgi:FdhD protein
MLAEDTPTGVSLCGVRTSAITRPGPSTRVQVVEYDDGQVLRREDRLATEEPLEIRLTWPGHAAERVVVTMRTPGADFELAAGFLFAEGLIDQHEHIETVAYCVDRALRQDQLYNVVTVTLRSPPLRELAGRYAQMSAACGVCGKQTLDDLGDSGLRPISSRDTIAAAVVTSLPHRLIDHQVVFGRTGGLHAAGVFTTDGDPVVVREDVGRHNAVDKVVGNAVLGGDTLAGRVLCVSGRVGFEIVQKAVAADVAAIVAVGAPSSLAVDLGRRFDCTVMGFARDGRFVVYSGAERVEY